MDQINNKSEERFTGALGEAVAHIWSYLPPDVQHELFEEVVTSRGEAMRQPLAVFLHDLHIRTADIKPREMVEPDSLGG
jgi:hypothetical protein